MLIIEPTVLTIVVEEREFSAHPATVLLRQDWVHYD
jgi:hypothetical protein